MSNITSIVKNISNTINNDRTNNSILDHMRREVEELALELENGNTGTDGIIGESIDIIACALDMIFVNYPNVTDEQLDRIMEAKCNKWFSKYNKQENNVN
jgi:hypothetical protein